MFKRIIVAYDESPEANRALASGIELAKQFGGVLRIVTVSEPLPVYTSFAEAALPGASRILEDERLAFYGTLQKEAQEKAKAEGISVEATIISGHEVASIVEHVNAWDPDLLIVGRRHHSFPLTQISMGGTLHEIAEKTRCSILGVY